MFIKKCIDKANENTLSYKPKGGNILWEDF